MEFNQTDQIDQIDYPDEIEINRISQKNRLHFFYETDHQNFKNLCSRIRADIGLTNKIFKSNGKKTIDAQLEMIASILLFISMHPDKPIQYSRHKASYNSIPGYGRTRYHGSKKHVGIEGFSYRYAIPIINWLIAHEMVTDSKGNYYKHVESSFTYTDKLKSLIVKTGIQRDDITLNSETIRLRISKRAYRKQRDEEIKAKTVILTDKTKIKKIKSDIRSKYNLKNRPYLDYHDDDYTALKRDNLALINDYHASHAITLPDQLKPIGIDFKSTDMHRVFVDDFKNAGRFYGPWWQQISRDLRPHILIDAESTIELDYTALHPSICYALVNEPIPDDCYRIQGYQISDRPIIKAMFMRILNSKNKNDAINSLINEFVDGELSYTDNIGEIYKYAPDAHLEDLREDLSKLIDAIIEYHKPIDKYFFGSIWGKLQWIDSEMAENIMLSMIQDEIPCLSVHDSFVVPATAKDKLKEIMVNEFEVRFNQLIKAG